MSLIRLGWYLIILNPYVKMVHSNMTLKYKRQNAQKFKMTGLP